MASLRHRRNVRDFSYQTATIFYQNTDPSTGTTTCISVDPFEAIKNQITDIIDAVSLQMSFEVIINMAQSLHTTIKSNEEALEIICTIEKTILSIIHNVTNAVEANIIIQRIMYVKQLITNLEELDPICCFSYEGPIKEGVLDIITMFGNMVNILDIAEKIQEINNTVKINIQSLDYIDQAECMIISILENISTNVELSIIKTRIEYLKDIISKIDDKCVFYNTCISDDIFILIDKIINNESYDVIIVFAKQITTTLHDKLKCSVTLKQAENIIISILENISSGVELSIISTRVHYVKELIDTLY
jgi:hypothetical protein